MYPGPRSGQVLRHFVGPEARVDCEGVSQIRSSRTAVVDCGFHSAEHFYAVPQAP
jgi:hypothetical protein